MHILPLSPANTAEFITFAKIEVSQSNRLRREDQVSKKAVNVKCIWGRTRKLQGCLSTATVPMRKGSRYSKAEQFAFLARRHF